MDDSHSPLSSSLRQSRLGIEREEHNMASLMEAFIVLQLIILPFFKLELAAITMLFLFNYGLGFGKVSMGNEMGNNITSATKEEDNISEAEEKNLAEDAGELANGTSLDVGADTIKEDVMGNASKAFSEISTEIGKDATQEDDLADDAEGKIQTAEAEDIEKKATCFASKSTTSMLETDPSGDTHVSDVNMQNQILSTAEAEDIQVKATEWDSEDTIDDLGNVTKQEESDAVDVKEEIQMIPTTEAHDVKEKATGLISNNVESVLENDSLEGDADEKEVKMENQMHPTGEAGDDQEKTIGMASDCTRSSLQNDLSKGDTHEEGFDVDHQYHKKVEGKDDQGIAAKLDFDDKISESEDKPSQEDKQDGDLVICIANGRDVEGKTTILASDDKTRLNLRNPFDSAGEEMTEATHPEKSPSAGSVEAEGENSERLSVSSLEDSEKCGEQEDSCLRKHLSVIYHDHLDEESSIKQDEDKTAVLTLNAVDTENSELQESPRGEHSDHDEPVKFLSEGSLHGTEPLLKDNLPDANHFQQQIKDDVPEKDMECQEKMSCANKSDDRDGNDFGNGLIDTSETISDFVSIGNKDNPLKSDQEENSKVLYEERKLSKSGLARENPQDNYMPDQCIKDLLQENKTDKVNTNEDCNGEGHLVLDSSVFGIAKSDQVEEPKVNVNGLQCDDAYVNSSNKASSESSAAPDEKHSVDPEALAVFVIAGSTIVDFRHEKKGNHKNKTEDANEKPEASLATIKAFEEKEFSEKSNSDLVTIALEESFSLQNSDSSLTGAESTNTETTMSMESCSNNSVHVNGDYKARDSVTRLSTESNPDNPNMSCQMQKSPSFNLNLPEDSDQTPFLDQESSANEIPLEEKIVTVERSYSKKCKAPYKGLLREKEEEEAYLLVMPQTQDNHAGKKKEDSSTSPQGEEKRKPRSSFFSSFMCCATVTN